MPHLRGHRTLRQDWLPIEGSFSINLRFKFVKHEGIFADQMGSHSRHDASCFEKQLFTHIMCENVAFTRTPRVSNWALMSLLSVVSIVGVEVFWSRRPLRKWTSTCAILSGLWTISWQVAALTSGLKKGRGQKPLADKKGFFIIDTDKLVKDSGL